MRVGVLGAGAVGVRALRQWLATPDVEEMVVADIDPARARSVAASLGPKVRAAGEDQLATLDAVVLALPPPHTPLVPPLLRAGVSVVSVSDDVADVRALLASGVLADDVGRSLVLGRVHARAHVPARSLRGGRLRHRRRGARRQARHGRPVVCPPAPPGPRRYGHRLERRRLARTPGRLRPGAVLVPRPGGRARLLPRHLPDPLLLVPAFEGVARVSAHVSGTRRDRLTARLPMLWPTDPERGAGAVHVEVRGDRDGTRAVEVLGALDWPAVAAGGVAAVAALAATTAPSAASAPLVSPTGPCPPALCSPTSPTAA